MWNALLAAVCAVLVSSAAIAQTVVHPLPSSTRCPGDRIVWVNTRSGVYHFQGERYFGRTREGRFLCERVADAEGDRPTRNGQ